MIIVRKAFLACLGALLASATTTQATVVFDNTTRDLGVRLAAGSTEIGDEIFLARGGDGHALFVLGSFSLQYYGVNLDPNAQMRFRIYANDGGVFDQGSRQPGTVLFDSEFFPISSTERATLTFDSDFGGGLTVPWHFTWAVEFGNLGAGTGGLDLYGPPSVGVSYNDFWVRNEGGWELRQTPGGIGDFAARVSVIPEPSSVTLLACAGALLLARARARRTTATC